MMFDAKIREFSRQSAVISRQSAVISRQSTVFSHQSSVVSRQSSVISLQLGASFLSTQYLIILISNTRLRQGVGGQAIS